MSDATDKARALLDEVANGVYNSQWGEAFEHLATLCHNHAAALDCLEALEKPRYHITYQDARRLHLGTDLHAEARRKFEKAICGGK